MRPFSSRALIGATALGSALIAAACASVAPEPPLSGSRWVASSIAGQPVGERAPTIEFAADRLSGAGSCNRYFGTYRAEDGGRLTISGVGSTRMACEDPVMRQETAYFAALESARSYRRVGDTLVISSSSGDVLTFRPAA